MAASVTLISLASFSVRFGVFFQQPSVCQLSRLTCSYSTGKRKESGGAGNGGLRKWKDKSKVKVMEVFSQSAHFPSLRSFVDCTIGAAGHSTAIIEGHPELRMYVGMDVDPAAHERVLKESFKIYCSINDGIINLIDKFFDMPRHEAMQALEASTFIKGLASRTLLWPVNLCIFVCILFHIMSCNLYFVVVR
ncbi:hypothetical protein QQ045_013401 [Rhodiola kirilowii]